MTNVCQRKCHRDREKHGETWHQLVDIVIQVDIFRYFLSFVTRLSNIIIVQTILYECSVWMWWMAAAVDIDDCLHKTFLYPAIYAARHTYIHTCIIILSLGSNTQRHTTLVFHFSRCWLYSFSLFPSLKPLLFFDDRQKAVNTAQRSIAMCPAVWQRNWNWCYTVALRKSRWINPCKLVWKICDNNCSPSV